MQAKALSWWQRLQGRFAVDAASAPTAHPPLPDTWESPAKAIAFGYRIIVFGIATFLLWAALAPLDEGVPAPGVISVESGRKAVAPLAAGIVATIQVAEHQQVKAGEILLTLENTQARALADTVRQQHFAFASRLARLEAEQVHETAVRLPKELEVLDQEPWARDLLAAEVNLLGSRNSALDNELAILRQRLAAEEERLRGARTQLSARRQQVELLNEQVRGLNKLVEAGHTPRSQLLEIQRVQVDAARLVSELETVIAVSANTANEIRLQQAQRRKDVQRDLEGQIVETRRELGLLKEKTKSAQDELDRLAIRAPVAGQVVALQGLAAGSVVAANQHLMDIIPEGDKLLIDVQVAGHLIDRVRTGLPTDVHINAFPDAPQLVLVGQVQSLSADQMASPNGQAYFRVRIELTAEGREPLGERQLRAGMPVDAIIKTGERSFLAYLVAPLMRRIMTAFREV